MVGNHCVRVLSRARVGIYVATCIDKHMEREREREKDEKWRRYMHPVLQNAHMSQVFVHVCVLTCGWLSARCARI